MKVERTDDNIKKNGGNGKPSCNGKQGTGKNTKKILDGKTGEKKTKNGNEFQIKQIKTELYIRLIIITGQIGFSHQSKYRTPYCLFTIS